MGIFGSLFSQKSSTRSAVSTTDNKNAVETGNAVSGSNNTINVDSKESLELASGVVNSSLNTVESGLDTVSSQLDNAFNAFDLLLKSQAVSTNAITNSANKTLDFVNRASQTDFVTLAKDTFPYVVGAIAVFKAPQILKSIKDLF